MYRDLITHRQSCFVGEVTDIKYLIRNTPDEKLNYMIESNENIEVMTRDNNQLPNSLIKKGVKLPKCETSGSNFFNTNIHYNNEINDITQEIEILQDKP